MNRKYTNIPSKFLRHTVRDSVIDSILDAVDAICKDEEAKEEKGLKEFSEDIVEVLENTFDEDFENYSKESLKINMILRGHDDDETFRYVNKIKEKCLNNAIGVIDIKKPVDLGNLVIALLEI